MTGIPSTLSAEDAGKIDWDVVVIGGGMGGGTAAARLAEVGFKVLLIEKGRSRFDDDAVGVEVEQEDPEERLDHGKWPTQLRTQVDHTRADIWAPLGCGLGGSSLLYAAALQRLRPIDFDEQTLPNGERRAWPFSYSELAPFYAEAEGLFAVRGTPDPLEPEVAPLQAPPAMCPRDQGFFQVFREAGLHPYRLHVAMEYRPGCRECGGHICPSGCKRDALNTCVLPAVAKGTLAVLSDHEVERIEANSDRVTGVRLKNGITVRSEEFVLAAGAYHSPRLLLASQSDDWPEGLANRSGMVGRNLMFHASDFIAFWPRDKASRDGPNKTIALRDFYAFDGTKYGEFQSTGLAANYGMVLYALRLLFDQSALRMFKPLRLLLRIPAWCTAKLLGEATVFTTIVEDFPYHDNRVEIDSEAPSGLRVHYSVHPEFRERVTWLNKRLRRQLGRLRSLPMNPGLSLNFGHPCGTCRAGDDPTTSVLDRDCRSHDLHNLYIADSSFMPTSGGTNPSLTVAANALRVADVIARRLSAKTEAGA